jgi:hypothetical protein
LENRIFSTSKKPNRIVGLNRTPTPTYNFL